MGSLCLQWMISSLSPVQSSDSNLLTLTVDLVLTRLQTLQQSPVRDLNRIQAQKYIIVSFLYSFEK